MEKPTYTGGQLAEYNLTQAIYRAIDQWMARNWEDYDNATELAEECAIALGHDEWLDEETHPIWDLATYYIPAE